MVGGTTPPQSDSGEISRVGPQPSLAKQAVLTHRPGYFCLDNAFALIEGHPASGPVYGIHGEDSVWARLTLGKSPIVDICFSLIEGRNQTVAICKKVFRQRVARKRRAFRGSSGGKSNHVEANKLLAGRLDYFCWK